MLVPHGIEVPSYEQLAALCGDGPPDTFLLFRQHGEALEASSYLAQFGRPHRLRHGGIAAPVPAWIATIANAVPGLWFDRAAFDLAWTTTVTSAIRRGWTVDDAWRALREIGPRGRAHVDATAIADAIVADALPDRLRSGEFGPGGLVVGTIHAAKGREADRVILVPDLEAPSEPAIDEEARVLYVGLTRARKELVIVRQGIGGSNWRHYEGRVWRAVSHWQKIQIEVGRPGDLDVEATLRAVGSDLPTTQAVLAGFDGVPLSCAIRARKGAGWKRFLETAGATDATPPLAAMSEDFDEALWGISKSAKMGAAPNFIAHARWFDLATAAVPASSEALDQIPRPWSRTRLVLMPVLCGLGLANRVPATKSFGKKKGS
jgi:hypothetical protein